jgi:hypothetical protein
LNAANKLCPFVFIALTACSTAQAADLKTWLGVWALGDNKIRLSLRHGKILADGTAYYPSENFVPFPSVGEFRASGVPRKGRLIIRDGFRGEVTCTVIMVRKKDTLSVLNHDPGCGGHNVSFQGVYHRVGEPH